MSDALKRVYQGAGALDRYYEGATPVDLYRGRATGDKTDLMEPTLIGWVTQRAPRPPDVLVVDDKQASPQYRGQSNELVTESKKREITAEIVRHADQYIVRGCRTMKGEHRGVSVFDKRNPHGRFEWYLLPANATLPDALAVTRDVKIPSKTLPNHYTVAPKDDMPLSLFLQYLKGLEAQASLAKPD